MKVKNLIERLEEFNPEANIYFTLDLNSKEGYPKVEIIKIVELQLVGLLKKVVTPEVNTH